MEELGGGIGVGCKTRKNFEYHFHRIRQFKLKNGRLNVPHKYHSNTQLGVWFNTQIHHYRLKKWNPKKTGALIAKNIEQLLDIGFNF